MLKIGWASQSIVPDRPAMLLGQMHTRIAREAMDPLTLTALALDGSSDRAIVISADIVSVPGEFQGDVQRRVAARLPGVAPDNVFMVATHTHTSLVHAEGLYPQPSGGGAGGGGGGGDVMTPRECADFLAERAVGAAVGAWNARAPGKVARAYGHAVVAHNRRPAYADGHSQMYGGAASGEFRGIEGTEDHSLDMLFFWDAAGRLAGIVLNIPCPSQVDENLEVFSADYWHDIRVELRSRLNPNLWVLPMCGAAGDASPHFILDAKLEAEMRARRGISERQEIALKVANEVQRALACTKPLEGDVVLKHSVKRVGLTPRRVSQKERDQAFAIRAAAIKEMGPGLWWPRRLGEVVDNFDTKRTLPPVPVELHALRIADAVIATNPFELYTDYAHRIKARSVAAQTFVVQLASGEAGYLPTQRAVDGGGYGAMPSSCTVGPEGGQELVEHTIQTIAELFPEAPQAT